PERPLVLSGITRSTDSDSGGSEVDACSSLPSREVREASESRLCSAAAAVATAKALRSIRAAFVAARPIMPPVTRMVLVRSSSTIFFTVALVRS
ncbi:hypothetical protein, partial [Parabacteroides distasonis]|uniref:hypothetical protein n=1 Tax=Parabacteroides distasonis TaxID=823 RepID=UPI001C381654